MLKRLKGFDGTAESKYIVNIIKDRLRGYDTVLAFSPLKTEPDILPLLNDRHNDNRIALPYIENNEMHFSKSKRLQRNSFGFLEPEHIEAPYDKALMLVPLIAFDSNGYRLGRGGGFYDSYIRKHRERIYAIGIAYSISKVDRVPIAPFDEKLDEIIYFH